MVSLETVLLKEEPLVYAFVIFGQVPQISLIVQVVEVHAFGAGERSVVEETVFDFLNLLAGFGLIEIIACLAGSANGSLGVYLAFVCGNVDRDTLALLGIKPFLANQTLIHLFIIDAVVDGNRRVYSASVVHSEEIARFAGDASLVIIVEHTIGGGGSNAGVLLQGESLLIAD